MLRIAFVCFCPPAQPMYHGPHADHAGQGRQQRCKHATSTSTPQRSRRVCDGAWWRLRAEPSARARMRRSMRRAEAGWCARATWRRRGACRHPIQKMAVGYYRGAGREAGRTSVKRPRTVLARCVVGVSWCAPVRVRAHGTSPLSPHVHVHVVSPASHVCVRLSLSCAGPAWTLARPRWCALPGGVGTGPVQTSPKRGN